MKKTILIIDPDEHERQIFSSYLHFVGGSVLEARDGHEGVQMAEKHLPDLILLPLSMPRMDGWETMRRLQESSLTRLIPVIALTSRPLHADQMEEAGFCASLETPVVPFRVLAEVERCLGRLDSQPEPGSEDPTLLAAWT